MRRVAIFTAALAVGACSQPPATPARSAAAPATTQAAAPVTAPAPASATAQGSPLTGQVSGLSGQVTQLQGLVDALGGQVRETDIYVALPADTLFEFDKTDIRTGAENSLRTLAQLMGKTQGAVQLKGYTDAKGDDAYNLGLSKRRADAVKAWLVANGVPAQRLNAVGYGEADPVAPNQTPAGGDDPEGRARNRRVEAIIPKPR